MVMGDFVMVLKKCDFGIKDCSEVVRLLLLSVSLVENGYSRPRNFTTHYDHDDHLLYFHFVLDGFVDEDELKKIIENKGFVYCGINDGMFEVKIDMGDL